MADKEIADIMKQIEFRIMKDRKVKVDKNYNFILEAARKDYTSDLDEVVDFVLESAESGKISEDTRNLLVKILLNKMLVEEKKNLSKALSFIQDGENSSVKMEFIKSKKQYV